MGTSRSEEGKQRLAVRRQQTSNKQAGPEAKADVEGPNDGQEQKLVNSTEDKDFYQSTGALSLLTVQQQRQMLHFKAGGHGSTSRVVAQGVCQKGLIACSPCGPCGLCSPYSHHAHLPLALWPFLHGHHFGCPGSCCSCLLPPMGHST